MRCCTSRAGSSIPLALRFTPCRRHCVGLPGLQPGHSSSRRFIAVSAEEEKDPPVQYNKEFGYSRKDVLFIGVGLIGVGYALYYGLQAAGVEPGMAGNFTQLIIFVGLCVGWVGSYVFRVVNKDMTYVKQLKEYEDAVMAKRLEEMTDEEMQRLMDSGAKRKPSKTE